MSAPEISQELADNYRQLKVERGATWEQLASEHEGGDASIAAWFRAQSDGDAPERTSAPKGRKGRTSAPKGRRSAPNSEG